MADDFDTWREGEPDIEPGGDGTFDDWYEGQPLTGPEESGATTTTSSTTTTTSSTTSSSTTTTTTVSIIATDFSEYSTGSPPGDFTERWDTTKGSLNIITTGEYLDGSTKGCHVPGSSSGDYMASWDDADASGPDLEILTLYRPDYFSSSHTSGIAFRASGASGSEDGYLVHIWSNSRLYLRSYSSGSVGSVDYDTGTSFSDTSERFWLRINAIGTAIKVKVWAYGDAEPGTWTLDVTNSTHTGSGWVGLMNFAVSLSDPVYQYLAVSDGSTIPLPEDGPWPTTTSTTTSTTSSTTTSSTTTTTTGTYTTTTITGTTTTTTAPPSAGQNNNVLIIVATC